MGLFGSSSKSLELHVGATGRGFVDSGPSGFRKRFMAVCYAHKSTLANLSDADKELLHNIIVKRMRKKVAGSKISSYDRKLMRHDAQRAYKEGKISKEDLKDFSKIVVGLHK